MSATEAEGWREADLQDAAELLRTAYGEHGRHFAPRGTLTEWEHYARGLVERPGCGDLEPDTDARGPRRRQHDCARAHDTRGAGHDPSRTGRRASRPDAAKASRGSLVDEACRLAQPRAARQATLLVGEKNTAARKLYASMGFEPRATFIAATKQIS